MEKMLSTKRSPVYRKLLFENAKFKEINGFLSLASLTDLALEVEYTKNMAICDMSWLPRSGLKGNDAINWLKTMSLRFPEKTNLTVKTENGYLIIKLGNMEYLILADPNYKSLQSINNLVDIDSIMLNSENGKVYHLPKLDSHACFLVCGCCTPQLLAKLCAIDLRTKSFKNLDVVQTSIARVNAIVIRNDLENSLAYLVLIESSYSEYFWDCLIDGINEFDGKIIGVNALELITRQ